MRLIKSLTIGNDTTDFDKQILIKNVENLVLFKKLDFSDNFVENIFGTTKNYLINDETGSLNDEKNVISLGLSTKEGYRVGTISSIVLIFYNLLNSRIIC